MDNTIKPGLLNDTYHLVQLARESALAQGRQAQADKLSPVVENLKSLVSSNQVAPRQANPTEATVKTSNPVPQGASGVIAQSDFQTLLNAAKAGQSSQHTVTSNSIAERNQMVRSMAAGNMMDVDIARSLGMTREEVRLVLSVGKQ